MPEYRQRIVSFEDAREVENLYMALAMKVNTEIGMASNRRRCLAAGLR
jgi:hypothetical protein